MATEQKCEWTCDLCKKKDYSFSNEDPPGKWCRVTVSFLFKGTRPDPSGVPRNSLNDFAWLDVCDDCFKKPYAKSRSSHDQLENKMSFAKKVFNRFTSKTNKENK